MIWIILAMDSISRTCLKKTLWVVWSQFVYLFIVQWHCLLVLGILEPSDYANNAGERQTGGSGVCDSRTRVGGELRTPFARSETQLLNFDSREILKMLILSSFMRIFKKTFEFVWCGPKEPRRARERKSEFAGPRQWFVWIWNWNGKESTNDKRWDRVAVTEHYSTTHFCSTQLIVHSRPYVLILSL